MCAEVRGTMAMGGDAGREGREVGQEILKMTCEWFGVTE